MNPILIVGAGITGCVTGYELTQKGYQVIIIEKDASVGGLTKTFSYEDFLFDIGPHRFFTQKKYILDFILQVLKNDYTVISRYSEVYFSGKYYPWPLRPSVMFSLPLLTMFKSSWDLCRMLIRNKRKNADAFEDYVLMNYGPSLYNIFFKDYTEKFLGLSPKDVHSDWAKEGMKRTIIDESIVSRNLLDIVKLFFIFKPIHTEFIYPVGGMKIFCERLAEEIKKQGGQIMTNAPVRSVTYSAGRIGEVTVNGKNIKVDTVIWTGSLDEACAFFDVPTQGLEYLSLVLFNIEVKRPVNKHYQWCYYGSKDIIFSRVSMPTSFSEKMAPQGKGSLCVEVTCRSTGPLWKDPYRYLGEVKQGLIKVGLIEDISQIQDVHIEKIPDAYPIYTKTYRADLERVKKALLQFGNLVLAGRTGLFWYNNMDDCIDNGLRTAQEICKRDLLHEAR